MEGDNKNKNYEFVLLERIEGKIDAVIEDQTIIKNDVKLLKEDMDDVKSDIVDMKRGIKEMKGEINEIKEEIKEINGKLDNKAGKTTINDHEVRITSLENTALAKA